MACCNSWKTFSCRSSSRVTSAIDHTVSLASRLLSPSGRTRMRNQRPVSPRIDVDAHLLLQAAAFARRLEQPEDRLRDAGIADEHPLDRPHVVGVGGLDQPQIGGIGVDDAPGGIGDQDRVGPAVDQALDQRAGRIAARDAQHAGREREQEEHADHRQDGQQEEDVGLGAGAADQHQRRRRRRPAPPRSGGRGRCCRRCCPVRVRSTDARPISPRACCCVMIVAVYPIPRPPRRANLAPLAGVD